MTLYVNSAIRTYGTQIFTCATAYAAFSVNSRHLWRGLVIGIERYHGYGPGRTMTGTIAAFHSFRSRQTAVTAPHGVPYLYSALISAVDRLNSPGRTYLGTLGTLRAAISALIAHFRQHEGRHVG